MGETLRAAGRLNEAGVPFFWLSTYEGEGGIDAWRPEEQEEFWDHGARFVPVHRMVDSLKYLTKVGAPCVIDACFRELCTPLPITPRRPHSVSFQVHTLALTCRRQRDDRSPASRRCCLCAGLACVGYCSVLASAALSRVGDELGQFIRLLYCHL